MADSATSRLHPAHALCVYAEPLVARRRVLVIGDASLALDARLIDLGARLVHVLDPDVARARAYEASAPRGSTVRELPSGDLDVRDGAYDLALVPDLGAVIDRAALLSRLRRLVGPDGATLVGAYATQAAAQAAGSVTLDYYDLYDLVSLQFANVRMIGQVPFAGVALAELGEQAEEPAVSVDTQLAGDADGPEVFFALASQREVRLDPYAIIQLPPSTLPDLGAAAGLDLPALEAHEADRAALAEAVLRADLLSAQLEEQRALATRAGVDADRARRVDELEAALEQQRAALKEAEARAGDAYVRGERLTHDLRKLDEELQRQRDRATRLTKELDDERRLRTRAELDLGMVRKSPELAQLRERTALLEEGLRAAEAASASLQARLRDAERAIVEREARLAQLAAANETLVIANAELREVASAPRVDPEVAQAWIVRAERAEARLVMLEAQLHDVGEAQAQELAQLEVLLRQRAQAIAALEHELLRRETIARELIAALEEARELGSDVEPSEAPEAVAEAQAEAQALASEAMREVKDHLTRALEENTALRTKLDALALEVARREGELHTRAWRVAELEEQLAAAAALPPPPPPPPPAPPAPAVDVDALRGELNALRQALEQEHAARVRLESGEELAQARSELARQATLLEQLAREAGEGAPKASSP